MNLQERTQILLNRIRQGDKSAENELCREYESKVRLIAKNHEHIELEDAMQVGFMGLMKAVEKMDADKTTDFWNYAQFWVFQFVSRLANENHDIRLPDHIGREVNKRLKGKSTGDEYTDEQYDRLVSLMDMARLEHISEHNYPTYEEDFLKNIIRAEVRELLNCLTEREKAVIYMRYYEEMTLEDIGKFYHVTRERIRQIETRALRKIEYAARRKKKQLKKKKRRFVSDAMTLSARGIA